MFRAPRSRVAPRAKCLALPARLNKRLLGPVMQARDTLAGNGGEGGGGVGVGGEWGTSLRKLLGMCNKACPRTLSASA